MVAHVVALGFLMYFVFTFVLLSYKPKVKIYDLHSVYAEDRGSTLFNFEASSDKVKELKKRVCSCDTSRERSAILDYFDKEIEMLEWYNQEKASGASTTILNYILYEIEAALSIKLNCQTEHSDKVLNAALEKLHEEGSL